MARRRSKLHLAVNHERWLVSYADFITLLFAFFVVMYSVSQVSENKYRVLSDTLVSTFNFQSKTLNPIQVGEPSLSSEPTVVEAPTDSSGEQTGDGAFDRQTELPHMAEQVRDTFADLIERGLVSVSNNEHWLEIDLKSQMLFPSASANPSNDARVIFAELARLFRAGDNPIHIEGYTDDQPISTANFPSNWELSAARAAAVVKLLHGEGIAPERLAAVGYGEFRPIADNSTEAGRAQNRRVAMMIARGPMQRPGRTPAPAAELFGQGEFIDQTPGAEVPASLERSNLAESGLDAPEPALSPAGPQQTLQPEAPADTGVKAIKLENGGLLFTSDPKGRGEEQ